MRRTSEPRPLLLDTHVWLWLEEGSDQLVADEPIDVWLAEALADPGPIIEPLSTEVAIQSCDLPDRLHRDPADRMIVATARVTNAVLMTRDRRILDYAARGHLTVIGV